MKLLEDIQFLQTLCPYADPKGYFDFNCGANDTIWIHDSEKWTTEVDKNGIILRELRPRSGIRAICVDSKGNSVFFKAFSCSKVFLLNHHNTKILMDLQDWRPRGLCFGEDDDLFVSMRKQDMSESKVVRYRDGEAKHDYQFDDKGNRLYSIHTKSFLHVCQNRNGDICVADADAVVVLNVEGMLKFVYRGHLSTPENKFTPRNIATDINSLIITNDLHNHKVHILDCDGNFLRFIKNPPGDGGLSLDSNNNLLLGDYGTGEIHIIKYWE